MSERKVIYLSNQQLVDMYPDLYAGCWFGPQYRDRLEQAGRELLRLLQVDIALLEYWTGDVWFLGNFYRPLYMGIYQLTFQELCQGAIVREWPDAKQGNSILYYDSKKGRIFYNISGNEFSNPSD